MPIAKAARTGKNQLAEVPVEASTTPLSRKARDRRPRSRPGAWRRAVVRRYVPDPVKRKPGTTAASAGRRPDARPLHPSRPRARFRQVASWSHPRPLLAGFARGLRSRADCARARAGAEQSHRARQISARRSKLQRRRADRRGGARRAARCCKAKLPRGRRSDRPEAANMLYDRSARGYDTPGTQGQMAEAASADGASRTSCAARRGSADSSRSGFAPRSRTTPNQSDDLSGTR